MERYQASRSIRVLDALLGLLLVVLLLGTVVLVPIVLFSDGGNTTVAAEVRADYTVRLPDGSVIDVRGGTASPRSAGTHDVDEAFIVYPRALKVDLVVPSSGSGTGAVTVMLLATFGLLWLGLVNLRRIVRSSREDPFVDANVRRMRWVAVAVLLWPVVGQMTNRMVEATLDDGLPIRLLSRDPSTWTCILIGLGLLAIAQVLRQGVALRELEQGTV